MAGREVWLARTAGVAVFDVLSVHTRYWLVWPFFMAAVTYYTSRAAHRAGMSEAIEALDRGRHLHALATLTPSLALLALVFVTYLAARILVLGLLGYQQLLLSHVLAQATLDLMIPSLMGVFVGFIAAQSGARLGGLMGLALFFVTLSPLAQTLPALTSYATGINLYPVYDLTQVLPADPTWFVDPLYGFPMEQQRWLVAVMWLAGLGGYVLSHLTPSRSRLARAGRRLLVFASLAALVGALLPSSELRRDDRPFTASTLMGDQYYYQVHPPPQGVIDDGELGFEPVRYEMQLNAGRELHAKVTVVVGAPSESGDYRFTLYHGYRIEDVTDNGGAELAYERDGDFLTVSAPADPSSITLEYAGSGGRFVANHQGVFLPGYFAWYPLPGHVPMWDDIHSQVAPLSWHHPGTEFVVRFDAPTRLVTNLEADGGQFRGVGVAPTFIAGFVRKTSLDDNLIVVDYPAQPSDPTRAYGLRATVHALQSFLGAAPDQLKRIRFVCQLPGIAQFNGAAASADDTVFVSIVDEATAPDIVISTTALRADRENLKESVLHLLRDPDGFLSEMGGEQLPTPEELAALERARRSAQTAVEVTQEYYFPARRAVRKLVYEQAQNDGLTDTLRSAFEYLSSNDPQSEIEYLSQANRLELP